VLLFLIDDPSAGTSDKRRFWSFVLTGLFIPAYFITDEILVPDFVLARHSKASALDAIYLAFFAVALIGAIAINVRRCIKRFFRTEESNTAER
jgi:hypothetical protein